MTRPGGAARLGLAGALAVALGLAVFGYVGWDGALWDPRYQFGLHLAAIAAIAGLLAFGFAGRELPRTRLDLAILLLLIAFGVATLLGENRGLAVRALAAIVATAAMLPVALVAVRHRPSLTAAVVALPILALGAGDLVAMLMRRLNWYLAGGPGLLPPVRVPSEVSPFGSVAVPPFVILAAMALTLLIDRPTLRRWLQIGLLAVGIPLTLLSGSRSAWLAIAAAAFVLLAPQARRLRPPDRWTIRHAAIALVAAAGLGVGALFIAPRLTAISSLVYRGYLWRDTIAAWSANPLFGIGPGTMPFARQAAAPDLTFPVRQPHSHDLALGVLGDAGLLGLLLAAVLLVTFVVLAGPWRSRSNAGRVAFATLAGFAVAGLFEDLTFLPNFNLLVVLLAAVALADAGAVSWHRPRIAVPFALAGAVAAAAVLLAMFAGDAAALAYRVGTDAANGREWQSATAWLVRSEQLDPWHPATPKALTVAADSAGRPELARSAAERAVELNAGDALAWTNLAILCQRAGDRRCAGDAADRAVATATLGGRELINAALVYDRIGRRDDADRAYRLSLLTNLNTAIVVEWPRRVAVGDEKVAEQDVTESELNVLIARRANGEIIDPQDYREPLVHALALAVAGDRTAAEAALASTIDQQPTSVVVWDLAALLRRHWGEDATHTVAVAEVLHNGPFSTAAPRAPGLIFDIATFRAYPRDGLVASAEHLLPDRPWPWTLDRLLPRP
ncbi:MAG: O-antigen ligase family protein [Chloroflexota bacterium]|nr:O-antigen ligase family protein [Chloroflexota bacterium]